MRTARLVPKVRLPGGPDAQSHEDGTAAPKSVREGAKSLQGRAAQAAQASDIQ